MNKVILTLMLLVITRSVGFAQSVGIGTTTPDASALLELKATTKGFLPPRMTAAQKLLIPSPKEGLIIYQTDGAAGLYIYNGTAWLTSVAAPNSWTLSGNAGTDPFINFIGTTDAKPLVFRVANAYAGRIDNNGMVAFGRGAANFLSDSSIVAIGDKALFNNGTGAIPGNEQSLYNTAIGSRALYANTIGVANTATGYNSLYTNTTGTGNTAHGYLSLFSNTLGNSNTANGSRSLYYNTQGSQNTAIGRNSLNANTIGNENTAIGTGTLYNNTDGDFNTAAGSSSLYSNSTGTGNAAMGYNSLYANTTGTGNTASGYYSLNKNTTGYQNSAYGYESLYNNTTGYSNTAIGNYTLHENTNRSNLVAIGDSALFNNGIGASSSFHAKGNTAVGSKALYANTTGYSNTANGYQSLYANTIGINNTANGYQSLSSNASGNYNTANGTQTLLSNLGGSNNTATGFQALYTNTVGTENTANGAGSLYFNTDGNGNTATGTRSLIHNTDGDGNTAAGYEALYVNTSGIANTGFGYNALFLNRSGNYNSALGYSAAVSTDNLSNATAIGSNSSVDCSNCMVLGSVSGVNYAISNVKVGIGVTNPLSDLHIKQTVEAYPVNAGGLRLERKTNSNHWDIGTDNTDDLDFTFNGIAKVYFNHVTGITVVPSDLRLKKDITPIKNVLPAVLQLQPKTYHYLDNKNDDILSYGFIAQEVEVLFPDFVITKGVDKIKAIAYQNFSVVAIKAIQEQQEQIVILSAENKMIKQQLEKMEAAIEKLNKN